MDTTPQAASYDAIKLGAPGDSFTRAAPPPILADDEIRDLVAEITAPFHGDRHECIIEYAIGGAKLTGIMVTAGLASFGPLIAKTCPIDLFELARGVWATVMIGACAGGIWFFLRHVPSGNRTR